MYPRGDNRLSGSAHQIYIPQFLTLATWGGVGAGSGTAIVKIPCPDSRLRVKFSTFFVAPAGTSIPAARLTNTQSIYVYEGEHDQSGVNGGIIPCTALEGTAAASTTFPEQNSLLGYSREFVTAADYLVAVVALGTTSPINAGSWVAQFRYQPNNVSFTPDEWNAITANCVPVLMQGPVNVS